MALTDLAIRTAKPDEKPRKLVDEKGMYLLIQTTGAKLWRMNYRFDGKQKTLALGSYPETSLGQARDKRDEARKKLAQDIDPGEQRKLEKQERRTSLANTFEVIARDWMKVRGKEWSEEYAGKTRACMERHAFPSIGSKPIKDISAPELLAMLRAIEKRGTVDMAHRIQQHCGAVFRYAISTGIADADPTPAFTERYQRSKLSTMLP
ncbi:tyrosine-type recombinase/integrase [Dechloromonas sp. A34]|uniref:tyrosine-type recombinase/integrase n=1 Tax=Dechloromonas sp. A34 TaxID=447588 RepID=UPI0022492DE6|nr:integrase arm-type DNA-binding domain-containing protein [Dechloromonas sp. A34]